MKRSLLFALLISLVAFSAIAYDEIFVETGEKIKVSVVNTNCGTDHYPQFELATKRNDPPIKVSINSNTTDLNTALTFVKATRHGKKLFIKSTCRPITCYAEYYGGKYSVQIDSQDDTQAGTKKILQKGLTREAAIATVKRMKNRGRCANAKVLRFWSTMAI